MRCRRRQKGGKIEPKHLIQYPAQPSPFLGLIKTQQLHAFTQEIQVLEDINRITQFIGIFSDSICKGLSRYMQN